MIEFLNKIIAKLEQLPEAEQEKIVQEMLDKIEKSTALSKRDKEKKLSETLLLPNLEEDENLFERDKEPVREVIL